MTRTETLAKCIAWYVVALALAVSPYVAFGQRELVTWCVLGFPALVALIFLIHGGPDPTPFVIVGYLVLIAVAAKTMSAREQTVRRTWYMSFCFLLCLNVCVAWFGPALVLIIMRPGE